MPTKLSTAGVLLMRKQRYNKDLGIYGDVEGRLFISLTVLQQSVHRIIANKVFGHVDRRTVYGRDYSETPYHA